MGKPRNANGIRKSETITIHITGDLRKKITQPWKTGDERDMDFQSYIIVLINKGIRLAIAERGPAHSPTICKVIRFPRKTTQKGA